MTSASAILNPIQNPEAWSVIYIGDVPSPGVIPVNGIEGFDRKTKWDKKLGKGVKGANSTIVQQPPPEGRITFLAWLPRHFEAWNAFLPLLKYNADKTKEQAIAIFHPALADLDIHSVVTDSVGPWRHMGKGKYARVIQFHEWTVPPAKPYVNTPTTAAVAADAPKPPGTQPDPAIVAARKEAEVLLKQAGIP